MQKTLNASINKFKPFLSWPHTNCILLTLIDFFKASNDTTSYMPQFFLAFDASYCLSPCNKIIMLFSSSARKALIFESITRINTNLPMGSDGKRMEPKEEAMTVSILIT